MSIHKIERKSGSRYKAVVQIHRGNQICKVFDRKIDAERWVTQQRQHLLNEPRKSDRLDMTVGELCTYWNENYAKQHKAGSTVAIDTRYMASHILPEMGGRRLMELAPRSLELWMNRLRQDKGLAPKTCNHLLGILKKMLNDAVRWEFIPYNPISGVRPFKLEQQQFSFWTREEIIAFLRCVQIHEPELTPIFSVALYTGMRKGEIRGLKWDAVDLSARRLTVRRSFCQVTGSLKETTKSKRVRYVPINSELHAVLVELRGKGLAGDLVLPKFKYKHCYRIIGRLSRWAGVSVIRFHDLRHTFASHFMMAGGNIYDLQRILGHSTIAMTERYSHMSPEHLTGKTELLNFGLPSTVGKVVSLSAFRR